MSTLDEAVCSAARQFTAPGDAVTSWIALAGVRCVDGGGYLMTVVSDDVPPQWQIRGMLCEALAALDECDHG